MVFNLWLRETILLLFLGDADSDDISAPRGYLQPVMGFRGFARVRANPFLECRDNQRTRSCFLL